MLELLKHCWDPQLKINACHHLSLKTPFISPGDIIIASVISNPADRNRVNELRNRPGRREIDKKIISSVANASDFKPFPSRRFLQNCCLCSWIQIKPIGLNSRYRISSSCLPTLLYTILFMTARAIFFYLILTKSPFFVQNCNFWPFKPKFW